MTSYAPPDYSLSVALTEADFHRVSGVAFSASISCGRAVDKPCMIIIPQGNNTLAGEQVAEAWLWLEGSEGINTGTKACVSLKECCDPMLTPEEIDALASLAGFVLEGVVTAVYKDYE